MPARPVPRSSTSSAATPRQASTFASPVRSRGPWHRHPGSRRFRARSLMVLARPSGLRLAGSAHRTCSAIARPSSSAAWLEDRGVARLDDGAVRCGCRRRRCGRRRAARRGPRARPSTAGGRRRARCDRRGSDASASSTRASVCTSSAESGSSSTSTRGRPMMARATASRCRWPPDSESPCSPMRVSRPHGRSCAKPACATSSARLDVVVGRVGVADQEVLAHARGEQGRLLEREPDLRAQAAQ